MEFTIKFSSHGHTKITNKIKTKIIMANALDDVFYFVISTPLSVLGFALFEKGLGVKQAGKIIVISLFDPGTFDLLTLCPRCFSRK